MKGFLLAVGSLFAVTALILVLAGVGGRGTPGAWVPQGVTEIDVGGFGVPLSPTKASPISRHVMDPSRVRRIVAWFNRLDEQHPSGACAGGSVQNVTITFRSAGGSALATADSPAVAADNCSPIYFARGGYNSPLVDRSRAGGFIDRVQRLLGVTFVRGYLG